MFNKKLFIYIILIIIISFLPRYYFGIYKKTLISGDEKVYSQAGQYYLNNLKRFQLDNPTMNYNYEHPQFAKLTFGLSYRLLHRLFNSVLASRFINILAGTGICLIIFLLLYKKFGYLSAFLASFFLSLNIQHINVTSKALLDPLCSFFSLLTIYLFYLYSNSKKNKYLLLIISGFSFGLATSSKYTGILTLLIIIPYFLYLEKKKLLNFLKIITVFCLLGLISFFVTQPRLWTHPITKIQQSFQFNQNHLKAGHSVPLYYLGQSSNKRVLTPWWTTLWYNFAPLNPLEFVIFIFSFFFSIFLFLKHKNYRPEIILFFSGFLITLMFLSLQSVRLPHYIIAVTPFFALISGLGLGILFNQIKNLKLKYSFLALFFIIYSSFFIFYQLPYYQNIKFFNKKVWFYHFYPLSAVAPSETRSEGGFKQ